MCCYLLCGSLWGACELVAIVWWRRGGGGGGAEEGSTRERGTRGQTEGSRRGTTSAETTEEAGFGAAVGLKRERAPTLMPSEAVAVKRCQSSHQRRAGSGREVSSGWVPKKWQQQWPSETQSGEAERDCGRSTCTRYQRGRRVPAGRQEMKKRRSDERDMAVERAAPVVGVSGRGGSSQGRTGIAAAAGIEATGRGKGKGAAAATASASGTSRNLKEGG